MGEFQSIMLGERKQPQQEACSMTIFLRHCGKGRIRVIENRSVVVRAEDRRRLTYK